jgi:site-specific DNA-methyltransferase (adenine-specific)
MSVHLFNQDCLTGMARIPDGCIDLIAADLPYGTTQNRWDSIIPLEPMWEQYKRIIKPNGAIVLTAQIPFNIVLGASNLSWLRYEWCWVKEQGTGFLNANKMPLKSHENVMVFYRNLPTYNPIMTPGKRYKCVRGIRNSTNYRPDVPAWTTVNDGDRFPTSVLEFPHDKDKLHPTQKSTALFEYIVRTYTNPGELVLDNCFGSGTTAIACMNSGRRFLGFELGREYFKMAQDRVNNHVIPGRTQASIDDLFEEAS